MDRITNTHDFAVSSIINTSGDDFSCGDEENDVKKKGNKHSNFPDVDHYKKFREFTAPIRGCSRRKLRNDDVADVCHSPDRELNKGGHQHAGKGPLPSLHRKSCWGQTERFGTVAADHMTSGMAAKSCVECDSGLISIQCLVDSSNDFYVDEEQISIADTVADFGGMDIKVNPDISTQLPSSCASDISMTVKIPSIEMNNEKDLRIERLAKKLSLARATINEQNSLIIDLEKRLFSIAETVCAAPWDVENDTEVLHTEFERAKKIIQAQCEQLEIYRSLIDKLKTSKKKLKIELKAIKEEKYVSEESVDLLRRVIYQLQSGDDLVKSQIGVVSGDSDVLCLHDTFFKHIKTDLFEQQQLVMESVLCDHLSDALLQLETYKGKPELVIVHTGKNDIPSLSVDEMCSILTEIHAFVTNNGMKLIMCNITPSYEKHELARKVTLFNWNISSRLGAYDNVTICKGNSVIDQELLRQEYGSSDHVKKCFPRKVRSRNRPYQSRGKENYKEKTFEKQSKTALLRFN